MTAKVRRIFVACIVSLAFLAGSVHAATFTVNDTGDAVDLNHGDGNCLTAGGKCTLRAAIQEASTLIPADTIILPAGAYTLTIAGAAEENGATGDLDISADLTITGAGAATTTINGGALDRVIHITGAYTVSISGVTITNGADDGGGIYNGGGTLTLSDSTISGNAAPFHGGGIYNNTGTVNVTNSTISGNMANQDGGGIYNSSGTLSVSNSTISGNTATTGSGGGIGARGGAVSISDSTISGNPAHMDAGGIYIRMATLTVSGSTFTGNSADQSGCGGIHNDDATATITNSTISGNTGTGGSAVGGICHKGGNPTLTIINSTITGNTAASGRGGLFRNTVGAVTLSNTIVADQAAGADCSGAPATSAGHNLDSDGTCNLVQGTDLSNNANANLGALADNGGPTQTHALQSGSDALDAGDCNGGGVTDDQRGTARPQGSACDIGAYELVQYAVAVTVTGSGSVADDTSLAGFTIACPGACTDYVLNGDSVTLIATPGAGQEFAGWSGACSGTGNCSLSNITANKAVTATFVTPGAPIVTTNAASSISQTWATLNGAVSPDNGGATTVTFEYGTTAGYGSTVTADESPLADGDSSSAVSKAISALTCGTTYHFRVVGVNGTGTSNGADASFTTSACPAPSPSPSPSPSPEPEPEPTPAPTPESGDDGSGDTVTPPDPSDEGSYTPPAPTGGGSAPTEPVLSAPANGATVDSLIVTFDWQTPTDTDPGKLMSYLYICERDDFAGCESPFASDDGSETVDLARMLGATGVVVLFGLLGWRRDGAAFYPLPRGRLTTVLAGALLAAPLLMALTLASCGPSDSGSAKRAVAVTKELQPATTYYWKVMDVYQGGGVLASETRSFTTPAQ